MILFIVSLVFISYYARTVTLGCPGDDPIKKFQREILLYDEINQSLKIKLVA